MYNAARAKLKTISLDYILSKVTELQIFEAYLGNFKVGAIYKSPLRKDTNPSFGVFYSKSKGKLLYKDYGTGECGDIIKLISSITGITKFQDIIGDIVKKLEITNRTKLDASKIYVPTEEIGIGIVRQPFTDTDNKYWSQYQISNETLAKYNVFSIKYYLSNGVVRGTYTEANPIYAYKVQDRFKIYRPYADKRYKWRNNLQPNDIQGYEQLPKSGDICFITKSLKDVMCLHELGFAAISVSSETAWLPEEIQQAILKRFKRIIILFDRDVCGVRQSRAISLKTGLEAIFIAKKLRAKDLSDAIVINGYETVKKWLYKTLKYEETTNKIG